MVVLSNNTLLILVLEALIDSWDLTPSKGKTQGLSLMWVPKVHVHVIVIKLIYMHAWARENPGTLEISLMLWLLWVNSLSVVHWIDEDHYLLMIDYHIWLICVLPAQLLLSHIQEFKPASVHMLLWIIENQIVI